MFFAASAAVPAGVSVWVLVVSGALLVAAVLVYWFVKARDTLDHLDSVLPPRREAEDDERRPTADHDYEDRDEIA